MNPRVLVTVILMGISAAGVAQVSVGLQAGGLLSTTHVTLNDPAYADVKAKSRVNWQAGLIADIPFGEDGPRLIPELNYVNKGYNVNSSFSFLNQQVTLDGHSSISYLELPLNLAYAVELGTNNLILGAGPYGAYGLSGKNNFKTMVAGQEVDSNTGKVEFGSGENQLKRFDYGLNFMAGFLVGNGMMLKANYSLGLANLSNSSQGKYKNSYIGLTLAYFIKRAGQ